MVWGGGLRGVLSVGYMEPRGVDHEDLRVLETFAELAATACANADAHAGLAQAARTDGLTGCLNHAALHEGLAKEIERAARVGGAGCRSCCSTSTTSSRSTRPTATSPATRCCAAPATRCAARRVPTTSPPATAATSSRWSPSAPPRTAARDIGNRALARIGEAIAELLPAGRDARDRRRRRVGPGRHADGADRACRPCAAVRQARGRARDGAPVLRGRRRLRARQPRAEHERGLPEPPPMPEASSWPATARAGRAPAAAHAAARARQRARGADRGHDRPDGDRRRHRRRDAPRVRLLLRRRRAEAHGRARRQRRDPRRPVRPAVDPARRRRRDRALPAHAPVRPRRRRLRRPRVPAGRQRPARSSPRWSSRCGSARTCGASSTSRR